jgi:type I restriction enzyme R subunit
MQEGLFRRRRLPHWDVEDGTYFVTACLAGSIPSQGLLRLEKFRAHLDCRPCPSNLSPEQWETNKHKLVFARFDEIIDSEPLVRHLSDPAAASEVERSLSHFAGERYDLLAYVVMPSHFHWLFHPRAQWVQECVDADRQAGKSATRSLRQRIMQNVKGYSARQCNSLLGLHGEFWQDESYDHVIRGDDELYRVIEYIENNPVKAGLVDQAANWRWSSASMRCRLKIARGDPMPRGSDIPVCQEKISSDSKP